MKTEAMIIRLFMPQFAGLVESGEKLQTVRPTPKRMPKPGDPISLRTWTGRPYWSKQRVLRESTITKVEWVRFSRLWRVQFDDGILTCEDEWEFAKADGFDTPRDMFEWFSFRHGLPFEGIVIYWEGLAPEGTVKRWAIDLPEGSPNIEPEKSTR